MYFKALLVLLLIGFVPESHQFLDPFTVTSVVGAAAISGLLGGGMYVLKCKVYECCEHEHGWITLDFQGLESDLDRYLYGQHLVKQTLLRSLQNHMLNESPRKALVLSFHGSTGTGKNYASQMIAKRLYRKGLDSEYVKLWIGKLDFQLEQHSEEYTKTLRKVIREKVTACPRSLFIIDEMDYVASGVLDGIKPFLDHHEKVDGIDYRKAVFIFLSNTGAENITSLAFEFKYKEKKREDINMKDIRPFIENGAFNEKGGLQRAAIIKNSLVDVFVPFLPLEKEHVEACIEYFMIEKQCSYTKEMISDIAEELSYVPSRFNYFSQSGCKLVESTIALKFDHPCTRNKLKKTGF